MEKIGKYTDLGTGLAVCSCGWGGASTGRGCPRCEEEKVRVRVVASGRLDSTAYVPGNFTIAPDCAITVDRILGDPSENRFEGTQRTISYDPARDGAAIGLPNGSDTRCLHRSTVKDCLWCPRERAVRESVILALHEGRPSGHVDREGALIEIKPKGDGGPFLIAVRGEIVRSGHDMHHSAHLFAGLCSGRLMVDERGKIVTATTPGGAIEIRAGSNEPLTAPACGSLTLGVGYAPCHHGPGGEQRCSWCPREILHHREAMGVLALGKALKIGDFTVRAVRGSENSHFEVDGPGFCSLQRTADEAAWEFAGLFSGRRSPEGRRSEPWYCACGILVAPGADCLCGGSGKGEAAGGVHLGFADDVVLPRPDHLAPEQVYLLGGGMQVALVRRSTRDMDYWLCDTPRLGGKLRSWVVAEHELMAGGTRYLGTRGEIEAPSTRPERDALVAELEEQIEDLEEQIEDMREALSEDNVRRLEHAVEVFVPKLLCALGLGTGEETAKQAAKQEQAVDICSAITVNQTSQIQNPKPAPDQVWAPPAGVAPADALHPDGTAVVAAEANGLTYFLSVSDYASGMIAKTDALSDSKCEWICLGISTPHGRVMIGDEFGGLSGLTVTEVVAGVILELRDASGWETNAEAPDVLDPAGKWGGRTCYAPARPGERFRHKHDGSVYGVVPGPNEGRRFDASKWERLDPETPAARAPSLTTAKQILVGVSLDSPGGIPDPEPGVSGAEAEELAILERRCLDLGTPRKIGEGNAELADRLDREENRQAIDRTIAADSGPGAAERAKALRGAHERRFLQKARPVSRPVLVAPPPPPKPSGSAWGEVRDVWERSR